MQLTFTTDVIVSDSTSQHADREAVDGLPVSGELIFRRVHAISSPGPEKRRRAASIAEACEQHAAREALRSLDDFSETVAGLPYSLWALPACSWWLGWLVWLVRVWGTQKNRSSSLKMSRNTIRVFVVVPPHGRWGTWPRAHHSQVHCELCLLLQ